MEKRLCYCRSCRKFFVIDPSRLCPKCGNALVASVVTESEWNRSSAEQKTAFKATLSSTAHSAADAAPPRTAAEPDPITRYSEDTQKRLKSYRTWSVVTGVIGILSFISFMGLNAQIDAQGYMLADKTPLYLGCALAILCAVAGFYGMGVPKQPSRLNSSWILFIVVLIGTGILAAAYQMVPGWLCAAGSAINIYNGSKLKKVL